MKITQDLPPFKPITFTLESREEADAFWGIVNAIEKDFEDEAAYALSVKISNWFTNKAKL